MTVDHLLAELVAIDSVNPTLVPGGAGEAQIAAFVASWFSDRGVSTDVYEVQPGRPNVIARVGSGRRTLLLLAHTDTVGVGGMQNAFVPEVQDGRLTGRGAYDMKAGLAAVNGRRSGSAGCRRPGDRCGRLRRGVRRHRDARAARHR
jgi:acetylornithine deacetylase